MTRIILSVLVCGTVVLGASRAETTTYVEGNIAGVAPNTGGTLLFSDAKEMVFRTGLATVAVPYSSITKSELGATREISHGAPVYKVWARHKKTETQFLRVDFKNEDGEAKTMTLELAQSSAPGVLSTIQEHTAGVGPAEVAKAEVAPEAKAAVIPAPAPMKEEKVAKAAPAPAAVVKAQSAVDPHDAGAKASPPSKAGSEWWGDNVWKTNSNKSTWTKPAGTNAPEE